MVQTRAEKKQEKEFAKREKKRVREKRKAQILLKRKAAEHGKKLLAPQSRAKRRSGTIIVSGGEKGLRGLKNMGMTCFINVVLQACSCTKKFREYYLDYFKANAPLHFSKFTISKRTSQVLLNEVENPEENEEKLEEEEETSEAVLSTRIHHLFRVLWTSSLDTQLSCIRPTEFVSGIWQNVSDQFEGYEQQDAAEFFEFLLGRLEHELSSQEKKAQENFIKDNIQGSLKYSTRCLKCGTVTERIETFLNLRLHFPSTVMETYNKYSNKRSRKESHSDIRCSLFECFEATFADEQLTGEHLYECGNCNSKEEAVRTCQLHHLPDIFIMSLSRIVCQQKRQIKITNHVSFPSSLNEFPKSLIESSTIKTETPYSLNAVIVHDGLDTRHGHYRCLCLYDEDHLWYEFDDEKVKSITQEELEKENAYVLVYSR
eukprot:c19052_g1_i1.p1 GENE.c19052_g1_i1~~c19052_g1_i1.p1  ORF type:complete len:430 (+),score=98.07 c19052_g1_i1:26-1315(+)